MAVITQEYDIDLKATGWYPVVEMSQYDTGSRTVVLRVYDGSDLVPLDGCVARIDGRRSDGVEFSASCTIGANSTVSFVVSQEMTRAAGKHVAELVIIDAQGNTAGTQNFILDVEPASMLRDAAASADDRTLYDQFTDSVERKFNSLSNGINRTVEDISQVIGTGSKPVTVIKQGVEVGGELFTVRLDYDPVTALVTFRVSMNGISGISQSGQVDNTLMKIPADYLPAADAYDTNNEYVVSFDSMQPLGTGRADNATEYVLDSSGNLIFRIRNAAGDSQLMYSQPAAATWYARGGKYMGVETIGTGGNSIKVGTVTTGEAGTQASVTNSGTARDVVLDFTIPKGDKGDTGGTIPVASATTLGGIKVGDNLSITDDGTLSATGGTSSGFDPTSLHNIAIGDGAIVNESSVSYKNTGEIVIGQHSTTKTTWNDGSAKNIVVGAHSSADGAYVTVFGHNARATGSCGIALGSNANCSGNFSVALGNYSVATEANVVSVGDGSTNGNYGTRRIVNVRTPENANDAANKAYVDSKVTSTGGGSYTLPAATSTALGGIKVGDNLSITDDGTLSATGGASSGFDPAAVTDIVIGSGATLTNANGKGDIVIGKNAKGAANVSSTVNSNSIAIGELANAGGLYSCAVGHAAEAAYKSTAIGAASATGANNSVGFGSEAIGCGAEATAYASVALGGKSKATETYTVSVGNSTYKRRIVNVQDPVNAQDAATKAYVDAKAVSGGGYDPTTADSPVIGTNAAAGTNAIHVVAVGAKASADWTNSTALGFSANAAGNNAIAIGSPASASYMDSIAIGAQAKATKEDSIAIGSWANATNEDSVAIGFESATDADSTVSVGNATAEKTRRITNVGAPTGDNDAATKAYVDALEAKLTALETRVAALENK